MNCVFCGEHIGGMNRVGRNDTCSRCGRDLRSCRQCKFYDQDAYNECREVSAERVVDKERANFCDYFVLKGSLLKKVDKSKDAKKALEALFKK